MKSGASKPYLKATKRGNHIMTPEEEEAAQSHTMTPEEKAALAEEKARKAEISRACRRRYVERHRQEIKEKKRERYSPEKRRAECLRRQEAEKACAARRRARLKAEREAQQVTPGCDSNTEA